MSKVKVSIVIVYYKVRKEILDCINSIKAKVGHEIIVVDNEPNSSLKKYLPKNVKYIKSESNRGYGAGVNLGVKNSNGEYIFVLNPDTTIEVGAIDYLYNFIQKERKVGAVSPVLLDTKGDEQKFVGSKELTPLTGFFVLSFLNKLFPNNSVSKKYWIRHSNKPTEVDVAPGTAMMIKKDIFNRVGGFDEDFFLYFEETDLCKRIKSLGYKIFVLPKAKVVHIWEGSTKKIENRKEIFSKSRFYYFKKHYGTLSALIINLISSVGKYEALFVLVLLLALFLRFYRLQENLRFDGEIGDNYLAVKNYFFNKEIPLIGPPTSHPWLSFGPLFYWIITPLLYFGKFDPVAGGIAMAVFSLVTILLNYIVILKILGKKIALVSSYLFCISPLFLGLAKSARFFSLVTLFFYPFIYFFYKTIKGKLKFIFLTGLFLGLMYNFHVTAAALPIGIGLMIYKQKIHLKVKDYFMLSFGFLIPNIPFLIYDALHRFDMTIKLLTWIPYRVLGFVGLYPKNNLSNSSFLSGTETAYKFFVNSFVFQNPLTGVLILTTFIISVIYCFYIARGKSNIQIFTKALLIFFFSVILVLFIHGDPPLHYFLPIFSLPVIFLSIFIERTWKNKVLRAMSTLFLLVITILNFKYYFSDNWFYIPQNSVNINSWIPYKIQNSVADFIVNDTRGKSFSLERKGPNDRFDKNYAQNYIYLLWLKGNEPKDGENLRYTIYEDKDKLPTNIFGEVFYINGIYVTKTK
ncbi:glycosyltransferase [Candidatus Woesebacteria bacterium]|nr:glycosyltransferase [Candidatus Woesebacteria bacterium]